MDNNNNTMPKVNQSPVGMKMSINVKVERYKIIRTTKTNKS